MINYTINFQRDLNEIFDDNNKHYINVVREGFFKMVAILELDKKGQTISDSQDILNNHFGRGGSVRNVCFIY